MTWRKKEIIKSVLTQHAVRNYVPNGHKFDFEKASVPAQEKSLGKRL